MGAIFSPLTVPGLALGALCQALGLPSLGLQTMAETGLTAHAAQARTVQSRCAATVAASRPPRMVVRDFSQLATREPDEQHTVVIAPASSEPLYVVPSVVDSDPIFYAPLKPRISAAAEPVSADLPAPQIDSPLQPSYAPKLDVSLAVGAPAALETTSVAQWRNSSAALGQQELALLAMVNEERQERGLQTLTLSPLLCEIARAHSEDMCRRNYFDHIAPAPGPASPMDRYLAALGQRPNSAMVGENIYYRSVTDSVSAYAAQAHDAFMHSPGHRANILTPQYDQAGIGIYRNPSTGEFWVTEEFLTVTP